MGLTNKEILIWSAGVVEGRGVIASTVEQGPSRMYPAMTLIVAPISSDQVRRLTIAANNGGVQKEPSGFVLGGYAAVRGFLANIWPYLSPAKRSEINVELKRHKVMAADYRSRGLTG